MLHVLIHELSLRPVKCLIVRTHAIPGHVAIAVVTVVDCVGFTLNVGGGNESPRTVQSIAPRLYQWSTTACRCLYQYVPLPASLYHCLPSYTTSSIVYHCLSSYTTSSIVYHCLSSYTTALHHIPLPAMIYHCLPSYTTACHHIPLPAIIYHCLPSYTTACHHIPPPAIIIPLPAIIYHCLS